jgi:hypothetical protein
VLLVVVLSGFVAASFTFLAASFNNDHFVHLAAAQQMLFGEWPTRDFIDIGRPLQIAASAMAQQLFGRTLFAEAVLVSAAFGIAAALTGAVVFRITGSLLVSFAAVLVEITAVPRTYGYPKVLATAAGLWLIGYFLRRPSSARQLIMAAATTIAFLFRHDLGLYIGAGGLTASILAAPAADWRARSRGAAAFAGMVAAMVAPYLVYVELNGGVSNYFVTALQQNQAEAGYVWPNPLSEGDSWDAQLLYLFHLLPVAVFAVSVVDAKSSRGRPESHFLIAITIVAIAENFGLIRDVLRARIPDAVVPAVVLGAWLAHRAWQTGSAFARIPSVVVFVVAGLAIGDMANIGENLNRAGFAGEFWSKPWVLPARFVERSGVLQERFGPESPSRTASVLRPFFLYLDRCTAERHRLFLGGLIPEVAYLARRPFAGGGYEHYNFSSPTNQRRVVERLRRQLVPFALIPSKSAAELDVDLPDVAAYFRERYVPLADFRITDDERIHILIDSTLPSTSQDAETGWPCFTNA